MSKSFRIDLGNRQSLTVLGWVVVILAALSTFGVGATFLQWEGTEDPFHGAGVAFAAGISVLAAGRLLLRVLGVPFQRPTQK